MMLSSVLRNVITGFRSPGGGVGVRSVSVSELSKSSCIPAYETLAVTVPKPFVYHVQLNRPNKYNAINYAMWIELGQCFKLLSSHEDCRAVVLSGEGKFFTAGIDLQYFMEYGQKLSNIDDAARKAKALSEMITACQESVTSVEKCAKPVLVAVHGGCIGAGVSYMTAADIRYCSEDSWFSVKEVEIGLAADVGALQRLPKVVGNTSLVRELCYTGCKFGAKEALDMGLVSKLYPSKHKVIDGAIATAEEIAARSPVAVQATKKNLVYSQSRPTDEGLDHIHNLNQLFLQSEDVLNAVMSVANKQDAPIFSKL